jgi:hypothetical protein
MRCSSVLSLEVARKMTDANLNGCCREIESRILYFWLRDTDVRLEQARRQRDLFLDNAIW